MERRQSRLEKQRAAGLIVQVWGPWAVAIDFLVWLAIHIGVSVSIARIPISAFKPESWLYRQRRWEMDGRIYQRVLRIRSWKHRLPDGAAVSKSGFRKKRLQSSDADYLRTFILETCRAELTHWLIFIFSPIFFLWNDWRIGMVMIVYGIAANLPCITSQRFNRIRLQNAQDRSLAPQLDTVEMSHNDS